MNDPNQPEVLLSVPTDLEASVIVGALSDYGIEAQATGGYTAGFRAEAPGEVHVVVRRAELDRARTQLAKLRADLKDLDWSQVNIKGDA